MNKVTAILVGDFQGIRAISMPMAQVSVMPAMIRPTPTMPDRAIQAGLRK